MKQTTVQKTSRFSKLKVGIAAVALGALLVVPSASADTEPVSFEISGGAFTIGLSEGSMAAVPTYGMNMSTTGSIAVEVSDMRGTDGNWDASLAVANFTSPTTDEIPAANMDVTGNSVVDSSGGVGEPVTTTAIDLSTAKQIASAIGATGVHTWTSDLGLDIPDGTKAGVYSSTLTLTSTPVVE
jgi:hypothetical protein